MAAVCFVIVLGQASLTHTYLLFHRTECYNAQLCEKWSKELTFLLPEEFADRLEKHLHLRKQWEMSAHYGTFACKYCIFHILYIKHEKKVFTLFSPYQKRQL